MKALVIHGARDLRLTAQAPQALAPGQVRVATRRGGICGSDLHYFADGGFGAVRLREPMILGHEVSGVIAETGAGVSGLAVGDLVAVSPSRPCGACAFCQQGLPNHCENMAFYGSAMPMPHVQGAFRQDLVANAVQCVPAGGLDPAQAAMAEPLSVALHAMRRAGEVLGRRVLVTGSGPIGVLVVMAARRAGAAEIVVADILDRPLEFAAAAGADRVMNSAADPDAMAEFQSGKGYFDIHVECSGAPAALAAGIAATRPRGVIVQLGLSGDMTVPIQQITAKELSLNGSFRFHEEFATAIGLMRKGLIDTAPLVSHCFPLEDYEDAFATALDKGKSMKVQLEFS